MAVTTAIASGGRLPTGAEVSKGTAQAKALAVQNGLLEMLKECHVISIASISALDSLQRWEVEYVHCPGGGKKGEDTLMVESYTKGLRPVNAMYSMTSGELMRVRVLWA